MLAQLGKHNPRFVELLQQMRAYEVEQTMLGSSERFDTHKGRVSMLTELLQQIAP